MQTRSAESTASTFQDSYCVKALAMFLFEGKISWGKQKVVIAAAAEQPIKPN